MDQSETGREIGSGRALVPLERAGTAGRAVGGRPRAEFVTQLLMAGDPELRASRLDRTRVAAESYRAQATRRG